MSIETGFPVPGWATFFINMGDYDYPRNLLIKDKVNQVRCILNLPCGEIGASPPAAVPSPDEQKLIDMGFQLSDARKGSK